MGASGGKKRRRTERRTRRRKETDEDISLELEGEQREGGNTKAGEGGGGERKGGEEEGEFSRRRAFGVDGVVGRCSLSSARKIIPWKKNRTREEGNWCAIVTRKRSRPARKEKVVISGRFR